MVYLSPYTETQCKSFLEKIFAAHPMSVPASDLVTSDIGIFNYIFDMGLIHYRDGYRLSKTGIEELYYLRMLD